MGQEEEQGMEDGGEINLEKKIMGRANVFRYSTCVCNHITDLAAKKVLLS